MSTIAVVIPCFKVKKHILNVVHRIGPEVSAIYVVDDDCPEQSGNFVESNCTDPRIRVLYHRENKGVGGATKTGFLQALQDGHEIMIKVDGDGQMDPKLIPRFIRPIKKGYADYTKGNRFFSIESVGEMPRIRVVGNAILSFLTKVTSGYWNLMDPANGYLAIHRCVLAILPLKKIEDRYFFETDMLFRLNTFRAVISEVPMDSIYANEKSNLSILKVVMEFPRKHLVRCFKRIYYNYFLRDFNMCSIELTAGLVSLLFGVIFGSIHWYLSISQNIPATTGTVMVAALPIILGFQLLLAAIHYDVTNIPEKPIHPFFNFEDVNRD